MPNYCSYELIAKGDKKELEDEIYRRISLDPKYSSIE